MTSNTSANHEMAEFWGGDRGQAWADSAARYDAQLERYALRAVGAGAPLPGDTVVDIGCGTGATTIEAARAVGPTGKVVGIDFAAPMIERAHELVAEAGLNNISFIQADIQTFEPPDLGASAAISRFGVMFFDDPVLAFSNIAKMTRDRGRLAFVCWGPVEKNEWIALPAVAMESILPLPEPEPAGTPGPFAFADQDYVERLLTEAGWSEVTYEEINDPLYLGGPSSVQDAVDFVLDTTSVGMKVADRRADAAALISEAIAPRHDGTGVKFHANARVVIAHNA